MACIHYFNIEVAEKYGVHCAVILQNLWHWIQHNEANNINYHDGYYWTYNSTKAFEKLFPYINARQIGYALKKLRDDGIIITGNYNEMKYDKTLWYAITKKGISILQNCQTDETNLLNGDCEIVEPIPYNNPDYKNADNNTYTRFKKPSVEEIKSYIDEKGYNVDAEMFFDFYESKGWLVGKNKMKDWKAAVRTWNRNRKDNNEYNQVKGKSSEARRKFGETSMSEEEVQRGLKKMFGNQIPD